MTETPVLSVIAPCLNEEDNIAVLAERMLAAFGDLDVPAELVLVDDGSTDGTWAAIEAQMEKHPAEVRGRRHEKNRGIVGGWLSGLDEARGELVCLIDADLQNRPEDIPRLYEAYDRERPDLVQAVRHPTGSKRRIVFSRALNHLLNVSFGMNLRDNKSGFILCPRNVLADILADHEGYEYFQSFIGVAAGARGYRFAEVDTAFDERHAGESFLSQLPVKVSLAICGELLRYRIATLRRR